MKRIKAIFFTILFISWIIAVFPGISVSANQNNPYAGAKITVKIIPSVDKTFGYDILVKGRTLIHQPNIPAVSGNKGFATKERARKVADFVVRKIRKNQMPPSVTVDDLNKMSVLK